MHRFCLTLVVLALTAGLGIGVSITLGGKPVPAEQQSSVTELP